MWDHFLTFCCQVLLTCVYFPSVLFQRISHGSIIYCLLFNSDVNVRPFSGILFSIFLCEFMFCACCFKVLLVDPVFIVCFSSLIYVRPFSDILFLRLIHVGLLFARFVLQTFSWVHCVSFVQVSCMWDNFMTLHFQVLCMWVYVLRVLFERLSRGSIVYSLFFKSYSCETIFWHFVFKSYLCGLCVVCALCCELGLCICGVPILSLGLAGINISVQRLFSRFAHYARLHCIANSAFEKTRKKTFEPLFRRSPWRCLEDVV